MLNTYFVSFVSLLISILVIIYCLAYIYRLARPSGPSYVDSFPNGKKFLEKHLQKFSVERSKQNPKNEPVGPGTNRCHFCGHEKIKTVPSILYGREQKSCCNCLLLLENY